MNLSKPTDGKLPTKRVWMAGGISILGSVIANLAVYWVGRMVVNPDPGFQPLAGPGPTIFFTVAFLLVATLVYLGINAYTTQPVRIFTIVAVIVFLVGLIPDFLLFGEGTSASMGMGGGYTRGGGAADPHAHCGLCNYAVGLHPVGPPPLTWV